MEGFVVVPPEPVAEDERGGVDNNAGNMGVAVEDHGVVEGEGGERQRSCAGSNAQQRRINPASIDAK